MGGQPTLRLTIDNGLLTTTAVFTGIIHKIATVAAVTPAPAGQRLVLTAPGDNHVLGESIAVNGVCLTVAAIHPDRTLAFDVIPETLDKTNLGALRPGDGVHVERSLRAGDPIDGHFVQGHVDGTGKLLARASDNQEFRLRIQAPPHLAVYLSPKGSIAIDGVSLTLAKVEGDEFEVALIPTTLELTTLGRHEPGYAFNLEADMLTKAVVSYLERQRPPVRR
jgi:riboflavin synthase